MYGFYGSLDYSVRQTKPTPPEQPQKAQNYVSDTADGCYMLKYVLSANLVIFVSLFQISGAKRKEKPALLENRKLVCRSHYRGRLTQETIA